MRKDDSLKPDGADQATRAYAFPESRAAAKPASVANGREPGTRPKKPPNSETRSRTFTPLAYDDPSSVGDLALVRYCPQCRTAKAEFLDDENAPSNQLEWREATEAYIVREHQGSAASRSDVQ